MTGFIEGYILQSGILASENPQMFPFHRDQLKIDAMAEYQKIVKLHWFTIKLLKIAITLYNNTTQSSKKEAPKAEI